MIKDIIRTMRPRQWYKNFVIFVCIIFSNNLLNTSMWLETIAAFLIFCMLSGASYIMNDLKDIEKDRHHPKKKTRPIASGNIGKNTAWFSIFVLLFISIASALKINTEFAITSIFFLISNLIYTYILKKIVIADILSISVNFVIRAIAGCLAIGVFISPWLIICTFFLALFLAIGKRRHELILLGESSATHRQSLEDYTPTLLDHLMTITTTTIIMSYTLYTVLSDNKLLIATIPLAVYDIFRYMHLVHKENFGGEPELIFKDKELSFTLALWTLMVIAILYYPY